MSSFNINGDVLSTSSITMSRAGYTKQNKCRSSTRGKGRNSYIKQMPNAYKVKVYGRCFGNHYYE